MIKVKTLERDILDLYARYKMANMQTIQNNLSDKIKLCGLLPKEISGLTDISVNTIYAINRSEPYSIGFITAIQLCDLLEISIDDIIQDGKKDKTDPKIDGYDFEWQG